MSFIIDHLKPLISEKPDEIKAWFDEAYSNTDPLFYCSVDIRHSGFKMAPVDTNLFPAGFNNLSEKSQENASERAKHYIERYYPETKNILIIPENHTRNLFYLDNLHTLKSIIENAGFNVRIGGMETEEDMKLESKSGHKIKIEKISRKDNCLVVGQDKFTACTIIMNNDLTSGAPEIIRDLEKNVIPPVGMGWYRRSKTTHFDSYANVTNNFAYKFKIDPWLISTEFHKCGKINFKERTGMECVATGVEKVLRRVQKKYEEYGIKDDPYVFIKADSGTYGMGIMTVKSGDEVMEINKKSRNKMNVIKEGTQNTEVIIQEGIPTIDNVDGKTAESMMYLIGCEPVGCAFRINESRDEYGNLNSPGMEFKSACDGDIEISGKNGDMCPVQGLIAKLASLAASRECYEAGWEI